MPISCSSRVYIYGALTVVVAIGTSASFIALNKTRAIEQKISTPGPLPVRQVDEDGFSLVRRPGSVDLARPCSQTHPLTKQGWPSA